MGLLTVAYVVTAAVCIFCFVNSAERLIRKKKKITESLIKGVQAVVITVAVFVCFTNRYVFLTSYIPEGKYHIEVSFRALGESIKYLLPGDLIVEETERYEDNTAYYGAVEVESTRVIRNRVFYLECIYFGGRGEKNKISIEQNVVPNTDIKIDDDSAEYIINIGEISLSRLGIDPRNNWSNIEMLGQIEFFAITISGILQIFQYFVLDKERKEREDESKVEMYNRILKDSGVPNPYTGIKMESLNDFANYCERFKRDKEKTTEFID